MVDEENDEGPFEAFSEDEARFASVLLRHQVRFIVAGGYAVRAHGYLRYAHDLDLVIDRSVPNLLRLEKAFEELRVPNPRETVENFASAPNPQLKLSLGLVEMMAAVESLSFLDLAKEAITISDAGFTLAVISARQLIYVKERSLARGARKGDKEAQDLKDVEELRRRVP
jgi:hypothetical protein